MRRIGSSAVVLAAALSLAGGQKKKAPEAHAVVAGTVFRDPGFAFPGVEVVMTNVPEPGGREKLHKERAVSSERGEFAFAVAPVESHYKVAVSAKGYGKQEKTVEIRGEERVDLTFMLEPEPK